jgi:hypothetical protein
MDQEIRDRKDIRVEKTKDKKSDRFRKQGGKEPKN